MDRSAQVLGISCFYHDAAAALVSGSRIVAAAQEERFSRRKHDASFPARAIRDCLDAGDICSSPARPGDDSTPAHRFTSHDTT